MQHGQGARTRRAGHRIGRGATALVLACGGLVGLASAGTVPAAAAEPSGGALAWGDNYYRQLGDGNVVGTKYRQPTPAAISGVTDIVGYGGGTYAKTASGWKTWGYGANGEACNGSFATNFTPVDSQIPATATVSGGAYNTYYLDGGAAYACGSGPSLGNGTTTASATPVAVTGLATGVASLAGGPATAFAVMSDGTVRSWGDNYSGQLGDGTTASRTSPGTVPGIADAVAVAAGYQGTLVLRADHTVVGFGRNAHGELGDGTTTERHSPVAVAGLTDVQQLRMRNYWSMALKSDGTVWTWGGNYPAQLGDGTSADSYVPKQVTGLPPIVQIDAGDNHAVALAADGTVWTWGDNYAAQLGNSSAASLNPTPAAVTGVVATKIAAGRSHTAALKSDGTVVSWGDNAEWCDRQRRDAGVDAPHHPGSRRRAR